MYIPDYFSFQIPAVYTSISFVPSSRDNVKITLLLLPAEKINCQLEKAIELSIVILMSYTKRTFKICIGKTMPRKQTNYTTEKSFNVRFSNLIIFPLLISKTKKTVVFADCTM